ncbi:voltage-gated potassium channel [Bacillus mesophilus]|uniref:Potassium channel protein n=1 Tax=Bacillus mesophilus TaxID=1808955 RepID=A0A6M0Q6L9_9BACI|nr:potassium channel family protein [Bacillus mesophilus]MBM7660475.1 voltage-gated potassium channel [Bacillus mesophilus]NEY71974.1 potassium channel protein [Bacillus mesophilus]
MIFLRRILLMTIKLDNWVLFWSSLSLIFGSTFIIHYLEPETFTTPFVALWWVMTTVTTVGYGDYSPTTVPGRVFAIFLYIFGIGLIGVVIGKIVDFFSEFKRKREEGRMVYKGDGHLVIIGWSSKASFAVQEILESTLDTDVVIIDQLERAPLILDRVHYINGQATKDETLMNANILKAKAVLIFADDKIQDDELADGKSLLIASSIERLGKHVHTIVEVLNENHIKNFQHIHIDDFLLSHETVSGLAVRAAITKGITGIYSQLISRRYGDDLYQLKPSPKWKTYKDAFHALLIEGATLIADKEKLDINRRLEENISQDSLLYIICDQHTFNKIQAKYAVINVQE